MILSGFLEIRVRGGMVFVALKDQDRQALFEFPEVTIDKDTVITISGVTVKVGEP